MNRKDIGLAILVVAIWGLNFVVIKVGLKELPPILLCALRFFLAAFPAVFFIKRPTIPFRSVIAFGLVMFVFQFALLFSGMYAGTTAGMASLMLQVHVFFTVALAVVFLAEQPSVWQIIGALTAFSGIGLVAAHTGGEISALGLILIVAAAASWGIGNLIAKKLGKVDMLALVVWGSLIAWPPLLLLSYLLEQGNWSLEDMAHLSWPTMGGRLYRLSVNSAGFRRVELAVESLSSRDSGAVYVAGAGVRLYEFSASLGRAAVSVEASRCHIDHCRAVHQSDWRSHRHAPPSGMSKLSPELSEKPYWPNLKNQFMENQIHMIPLLASGFFLPHHQTTQRS
jgi:O-acetylserine/cysteine efflux transporter